MAPKKQAKSGTSASRSEATRSDSTSWDASQEMTTQRMSNLMELHREKVIKQRQNRKQEILTRHNKQVDGLKTRVATCVQNYAESLRAIRRPKVEHLLELVNKRREIEAKIDRCHAELESALLSASRQLQAAVEGRAEDIE